MAENEPPTRFWHSADDGPYSGPGLWDSVFRADALTIFQSMSLPLRLLLIFLVLTLITVNVAFFRLASVLDRPKPATVSRRPKPSARYPSHLLVVLGSGGHTAEMLNMLQRVPVLSARYMKRTYVASSGDSFSALKAKEFETELAERTADSAKDQGKDATPDTRYDIVTVRRARRVHQSIITAPYTSLLCLWDCLKVLQGTHPDQQPKTSSGTSTKTQKQMSPDLILTNGPGTGVCVVIASVILLFFGLGGASKDDDKDEIYHSSGQMRTIFIESWARVETISLSGTILKPFVDRFLVQWPRLAEAGGKTEFLGPLIA